jgi:glycosyltransferase involved in cell wall biosynthesis
MSVPDGDDGRSASPRVRVVMARFTPHYGGHILQMRRCLPRLRAAGVPVDVVTAAVPGEPARATFDGIELVRLATPGPTPSLRMLAFGVLVFSYLLRTARSWDVLHVVGTSWHVYASILAARLLRKRVIVEMVLLGDDDPQSIARLPLGALKLAVWKWATRFASLSTALTFATREAGVPLERIVQIPVGVDTERFRPEPDATRRREIRESLDLPSAERCVVFIGAIIARKGVDLLVEAWQTVLTEDPSALLVLVGPMDLTEEDRAFRATLREQIDASGIGGRIRFTGPVDNVEEWLRASDVFVLPSVSEGLPNSVLEAMASGVPVVMTNLPGIAADVIRSEHEGCLLAERTSTELGAALVALLSDPARRSAIALAGRARVVEGFSITARVERYCDLYRALVESR